MISFKKNGLKFSAFIIGFVFIAIFFVLRSVLINSKIIPAIVIIALLFILYFILILVIGKINEHKQVLLIFLFAAGLAARLLMFGISPEVLSDDVYRYVWDGKTQAMGINPYLYPPKSKHLEALRDKKVYPKINHKQFPTVYPPVAQMVFFLSYKIGGNNLNSMRLIYLFFDFFCAFFVFGFLKQKKFFIIYWLSPLIIIETFVGMHLDIVGVSILAGSVMFFQKRNIMFQQYF